jgi:uncharacterized protein YggE
MPGNGEKFSRKQDAFLGALLSEPTIYAAAQRVGINETTGHRWLKDPAFNQMYREAKRQIVDHAIAQAQRSASEAVETLRAVMANEEAPASARVSASKTMLDFALKVGTVEDLEARLAALEAK